MFGGNRTWEFSQRKGILSIHESTIINQICIKWENNVDNSKENKMNF